MEGTKIIGIVSMILGGSEIILSATTITVGYFGMSGWESGSPNELAFQAAQASCNTAQLNANPAFSCDLFNVSCGVSSVGGCQSGDYCATSMSSSSSTYRYTCTDCGNINGMMDDNMTQWCGDNNIPGSDSYDSCMANCPRWSGGSVMQCGTRAYNVACQPAVAAFSATTNSLIGFPPACAAGVVGLLVGLPAFFNGAFSFGGNEVASRTAGGFNIFCSITGFCTAGICTIVVAIAAAVATTMQNYDGTLALSASSACDQYCLTSANMEQNLQFDVKRFYDALTALLLTLLFLSFVNLIVSTVTCCLWKKKQFGMVPGASTAGSTTTTTTSTKTEQVVAETQPVVVQAVVVEDMQAKPEPEL